MDFTTVLGEAEMNALGQGRLSITIHAKNALYNQISGYIVPRFTCDIFDCILSTIDEDPSGNTCNPSHSLIRTLWLSEA